MSAACGNPGTKTLLNQAETCMEEHPDSALNVIRAIDTNTLHSRALRARYSLLHATALDKNWIDTTDVGVVMPAVEWYGRKRSGGDKARAYYYLGRIQENGGMLEEAGVSFLKADYYSGDLPDSIFKGMVYQQISNIYSKTHYHAEALHYTELAYASLMKAADTLRANAALYRMAQDLNNLGRYSESDSLFRILMNDERLHPNLRQSLLCSHAINLLNNSDDYAQARRLFEEVISDYGTLGSLNLWGAYAYSLTRDGETKRADELFKQLEAKKGQKARYVYTAWKSRADAFEGNYESAYHLQKAASDLQDQNVTSVLNQSAIKAQKEFLEEVNHEAEATARRRRAAAWVCIILLIAAISLLFFLFKRRNEHSLLEKESLLEAFKELTSKHSALVSRFSDLNSQIGRIEEERADVRNQYIQMCQSHFSHLGHINEMLYYHSTEADNGLYQDLKKTIAKIGLNETGQHSFEKNLNKTFDDVMLHFREDFPKKKPRYYQLVSLLFAGFKPATIVVIIPEYNKHNVEVEKSRLKQMITNSDSQNKDLYLGLLSQ